MKTLFYAAMAVLLLAACSAPASAVGPHVDVDLDSYEFSLYPDTSTEVVVTFRPHNGFVGVLEREQLVMPGTEFVYVEPLTPIAISGDEPIVGTFLVSTEPEAVLGDYQIVLNFLYEGEVMASVTLQLTVELP